MKDVRQDMCLVIDVAVDSNGDDRDIKQNNSQTSKDRESDDFSRNYEITSVNKEAL